MAIGPLTSNAPVPQPARSAETRDVRAAQRAFFQTAMTTPAEAPAPAPARPVASAPVPVARPAVDLRPSTPLPEVPPARPLRPGSLLDIKV